MERPDEETRNRILLDFYRAVLPWGWRDAEYAAEILEEAGVDSGEFGEDLEEYCKENDVPLVNVDPVAAAMEFICQEANCPELAEHVYANCVCSCFDLSSAEAGNLLYAVDEDERNRAWEWLRNKTSAEEPAALAA